MHLPQAVEARHAELEKGRAKRKDDDASQRLPSERNWDMKACGLARRTKATIRHKSMTSAKVH